MNVSKEKREVVAVTVTRHELSAGTFRSPPPPSRENNVAHHRFFRRSKSVDVDMVPRIHVEPFDGYEYGSSSVSQTSPLSPMYGCLLKAQVTILQDGTAHKRFIQLTQESIAILKHSDKPAKKSKSPGGLVKKIDLVEMWVTVDSDRVTDKRVSFLIGWPWNDIVVTFGSEQEKEVWLHDLEKQIKQQKAKQEPRETLIQVQSSDKTAVPQRVELRIRNTESARTVTAKCVDCWHKVESADQFELCLVGAKQQVITLQDFECPFAMYRKTKNQKAVHSNKRSDISSDGPASPNANAHFVFRPKTDAKSLAGKFRPWQTFRKNMRRSRDEQERLASGSSSKKTSTSSLASAHHKPLFAQPLADICEADSKPPQPILSLMEKLYTDGVNTEGIMRQPANKNQAVEYRARLDSGEIVRPETIMAGYLLKEFLRNLPECIFTDILYSEWLDCADLADTQARLSKVKDLYARLPECNRQMTAYVFCVLHHISLNASVNKMDAENLAICTALSLLWSKNDVSHDSARRAIGVIRFLIEQANEVFGLDQVIGLFSEPRFMLKSHSLDTASTDDSLDMSIDDMPGELDSMRHVSIDSGAFSDDKSPVLQQGSAAVVGATSTSGPPLRTVCTTFVPDWRAVDPSLEEDVDEHRDSVDGRHLSRGGYRDGDDRQLSSASKRLADKQTGKGVNHSRRAAANQTVASGIHSNSAISNAEILQRNNTHMQKSSRGIVASVYVNNSKHSFPVLNSNNDNNNNDSTDRREPTNDYFFFGASLPLSNSGQHLSDGTPKSPLSLKGSYSSDCLNLLSNAAPQHSLLQYSDGVKNNSNNALGLPTNQNDTLASENRTKRNSVPAQFGYNETSAAAVGNHSSNVNHRSYPKDEVVQSLTLKGSQSSDCLQDMAGSMSRSYNSEHSDVENNYTRYVHSRNGPPVSVGNSTNSRTASNQPMSTGMSSRPPSNHQNDQRSLSVRRNSNVHLQTSIPPNVVYNNSHADSYARVNGVPSIVVTGHSGSSKHDKHERVERSNSKKHHPGRDAYSVAEAGDRPMAVVRDSESNRGVHGASNVTSAAYHRQGDSSAGSSSDLGGGFFFYGLSDDGRSRSDTAFLAVKSEDGHKRSAMSQRAHDKLMANDGSYTYVLQEGRVPSGREMQRDVLQVSPITGSDVGLLSTSAPSHQAGEHYSDAQRYVMNRRVRRKGLVTQHAVVSDQEYDSASSGHNHHPHQNNLQHDQPPHHHKHYHHHHDQRQEEASGARRHSDGQVVDLDSSHHVTSSGSKQQQHYDYDHQRKGQGQVNSGLTSSRSSNDIVGSAAHYPSTYKMTNSVHLPNGNYSKNNNHAKPTPEGLWVTKLNV